MGQHTWPMGPLEEVPAQQGCWGQLSHLLPARLHQLLWSQDSNPSLVTVPDFSFTSFVSGFRCKFSGWCVEPWLVLQGSCPAALIQSALLVGLAGCEHCKGLGGNVWGIQIIVLSPSSLCDGSGWLGERTGPSQKHKPCLCIQIQHRSGRFALQRVFTPPHISTTQTAHER